MSVVGGTMAGVTDDQPAASDVRVIDRMLAAGLSIEAIEQHFTARRVRRDGEVVTDPYTPAPKPALIAIMLD
jgi:hypothetical protein